MSTVEHDYDHVSPLTPIAASVSSSGLLGDLAEASRELSPELFRRLFEVSRSPSLLIATDYDGTIAPIVDLPGQAHSRWTPRSTHSARSPCSRPPRRG